MEDDPKVDQAVKRLETALNALDAAMEMHVSDERQRGSFAEQIHAFSVDRARLAGALDGAEARIRTLAHANRDVSERLDEAMATIRAVITAQERTEPGGQT